MTTNVPQAQTTPERQWIPGVILVALGTIFFFAQWTEIDEGPLVLGAIALVFIALFASTRQLGFFIPGAILAGLAAGVWVEDLGYSANGSIVVLGLAAGFIAIFVANFVMRAPAYWWPLIPGGILAVVGIANTVQGTQAEQTIAFAWPLVLIAVGVLVLFGGMRRTEPRT